MFAEGNLDPGGFTNTFSQNNTNMFYIIPPNLNTQAMTISGGVITAKFYHQNALKRATATGVVLQDENVVRGVFLGTNGSGSFLLESED